MKGDEKQLTVYVVETGESEPKFYQISPTSKLHRKHFQDKSPRKSAWHQHFAPPTLIKDSSQALILVYQYNEAGFSTCFYDLGSGKDIAEAKSTHAFVKYLPAASDDTSDRLVFLRESFISSEEVTDKQTLDKVRADGLEAAKSTHKEIQPLWYTCEVDFTAARDADEPIQLIDLAKNDSTDVLEASCEKSVDDLPSIAQDFKNWGFSGADLPSNFLQNIHYSMANKQTPLVITEVKKSNGLFSVCIAPYGKNFFWFTALTL